MHLKEEKAVTLYADLEKALEIDVAETARLNAVEVRINHMKFLIKRIMVPLGVCTTLVLMGVVTGCTESAHDKNQPNSTVLQDQNASSTYGQDERENPSDNSSSVSQAAHVSPEELSQALEGDKGIALIDVRAPYAFQTSHIVGAINIPAGSQLEVRIDEVPRDVTLYLIDSTGARAEEAWQVLVDYGFDPSSIFVVDGGMERWSSEGRPTRAGEPRHC